MAVETARPPVHRVVPLLQPGDRLSADEFHRRYEAMPECKKAELIEGIVYMTPPPVSFEGHGEPQFLLMGWLTHYVLLTPGVRGFDNITVRLDEENVPQPDAGLLIDPRHGGQARVINRYLVGPPEFVAEVSASTVALDRGPKRRAFERHGVREYLIWRVLDQIVEWSILRAGRYELLAPGPDGVIKSEVFPGLWLDVPALLANDLAKVIATVTVGTQSPEHAAFVQSLGKGTPYR